MNNIGAMQVTFDDLARMLNLPKGHAVTGIVPQDLQSVANQQFTIVVSGPQLPNHHEGAHPQFVSLARNARGRTEFF